MQFKPRAFDFIWLASQANYTEHDTTEDETDEEDDEKDIPAQHLHTIKLRDAQPAQEIVFLKAVPVKSPTPTLSPPPKMKVILGFKRGYTDARYETCSQCLKQYDTLDNYAPACVYHPGEQLSDTKRCSSNFFYFGKDTLDCDFGEPLWKEWMMEYGGLRY